MIPPHLCLISTNYKVYGLYLTFSLQVSWALGVDYIHSGSICSYGGVIFPEIIEHGYENVQSFRYLALLLVTGRENFLNALCISDVALKMKCRMSIQHENCFL